MNFAVPLLILLLLFFVILPLVSIFAITVIRYIYKKIRKKINFDTSKFITALLISVIGLALIPPFSYVAAESLQSNIVITGNIATITYNDDDPDTVYIDYNGERFQKLDTSISDTDEYYYSEGAYPEYGKPLANAVFEDRSFIEKYIYTIFRYPVYSQVIYPIMNDDVDNLIALDRSSVFCKSDTLEEQIKYYTDINNYDYYVEDYNEDEYYDIKIDNDSMEEILSLAKIKNNYDDTEDSVEKAIPDIVKLQVEPDYDMLTINGESKNTVILREIGEIYMDKKGKAYLKVEEEWEDDGYSTLFVLEISDKTGSNLKKIFDDAGIF